MTSVLDQANSSDVASNPETHGVSTVDKVCTALSILVIGLVAVVLVVGWSPANPGCDQNGYLCGGKQLALTGSMALRTVGPTGENDPMQFVPKIWIPIDFGTPKERYYPKYPIGLPLIYAGAYRAFGYESLFLISPIATIVGLIGCLFLARRFVGSTGALAVILILALMLSTVILGDNADSHAPTFCLVVWAMYLLACWWDTGQWKHALVAGLLLGISGTIRYSDGVFILSFLAVFVLRANTIGWRDRRHWFQAAGMLALWALPLVLLTWHNLAAMGTLTGYDATHESTGFRLSYFWRGWNTLVQHQAVNGIYFFYIVGLLGIAILFIWNWRNALFLAVWTIPSILLYSCYYFTALSTFGAQTRFIYAVLPGVAIAAVGLLTWPARFCTGDPVFASRIRRAGYVALFALIGIWAGSRAAAGLASMESWHMERARLYYRTHQVIENVPDKAVLFCDTAADLHFLQLVGDYTLYATEAWLPPRPAWLAAQTGESLQEIDLKRVDRLQAFTQGKTRRELAAARDTLVHQWIQAGRRVYVYVTRRRGVKPTWPTNADSDLTLSPVYQGDDFKPLTKGNPLKSLGVVVPDLPADQSKATQLAIYQVVPRMPPTTRPSIPDGGTTPPEHTP
jgi:hypothetical protein